MEERRWRERGRNQGDVQAKSRRLLSPNGSENYLDTNTGTILDVDVNSLSTAFNSIIDKPCVAVSDKIGEPLKIIVPMPPQGVRTKSDLQAYLLRNGDLILGMGAAALFSCGRQAIIVGPIPVRDPDRSACQFDKWGSDD
ncbi:hypothetical protein [Rhizobium sp. RAF56]|uniref:hypothetical protein n=1 Tax=Rhizobium sp. RAF56 TaxID=3233062 RepID=UPI003F954E09